MACVYWPSRSAARAARSIPWSTSGGGGPEPGPGGAEGGIGGGGGRGRPGARARRGGAGAVRRGGDRRGLLLVAGAQARVVLVGDVPRVVLELELAEGAQRGPLLLLELLAGIHGERQERAASLAAAADERPERERERGHAEPEHGDERRRAHGPSSSSRRIRSLIAASSAAGGGADSRRRPGHPPRPTAAVAG